MYLFSKPSSPSPIIPDTPATEHEEHPFWDIIRFSLIALIIVIPIRLFIAQPFIVSGASMENTFHGGEYLIVDQLSYYFKQPSRGEVIVFRYPRDPSKFFIKRIIGVPGDTVIIEGNTVTIKNNEYPDGIILNEPYITPMSDSGPIHEVLGDREFFVMGHNRDHSSDSRAWGVLQQERIMGRVLVRLFPPQNFSYLPGFASTDTITRPASASE